jgi:DNA processing protein
MEKLNEKYCLCALNSIFGFSPKTALAIISHLGSAAEAFSLSKKELDTILGPYSPHKGQITAKAYDTAAEELDRLAARNIQFIGFTERGYPDLLRECEDAPVGLYVRSRTPAEELFAPERKIAVVGTRDISPYGKEWCRRIVGGLAECHERPVIVSGLAIGTDICAHTTALEYGIPTIAVMATGPDGIYPYRHREYAERMADTPGCGLITDYPPGTAPLAIHFLRRNRIIAGLSESTILVESRIKGGGMMTCRLAFSYNREVYALPGRIDDIRSQGCNNLIHSKIANPIETIDSLISNLGLRRGIGRRSKETREVLAEMYRDRLSPEKLTILMETVSLIRLQRGITTEEISAKLGISYGTVAQLTGMLETDGLITIDLMQRCSINVRKSR